MFRRIHRTVTIGLLRALILYGIALTLYLFSTFMVSEGPWKSTFAVVHLLAALYLVFCFARFYSYTDELQRRVQAEALVIAFGGTALFGVVSGSLESFGMPGIGSIYLFPLMVALWFGGMFITERRYE